MTKTSPLFKAYATDPKLEKEGVWVQYGFTERDGKEVPVRVLLARAGGANIRFDKVLEHKSKPYKRQIQSESLSKEMNTKIMQETYAETVVLDWENMQNEAGEFLDHTPENVVAQFVALPDWYTDVLVTANKTAIYKLDVLEEDAKN